MTRRGKVTLAALSFGHFINDSYSSILYPLLPLIKTKLDLSYAQVFWLVPIYQFSASLMQPVYGYISDRYMKRGFAVFGPIMTAFFLSIIGLSANYGVLLAVLILGGVGIGAFHPQAAAMASRASGNKRRLGMSVFSSAGTIGLAFGPSMVALTVDRYGLERTYLLGIFGVLALFVLLTLYRKEHDYATVAAPVARGNSMSGSLRAHIRPLLLLYGITVLLSANQLLVVNYIPFWLNEQGLPLQTKGTVISIFLLFAGLGGIVGGATAERMGGRRVTIISRIATGPALLLAFLLPSPVSLFFLGLGGLLLASTIPVNVSMAQELVPERTSTISALMMGFAWGMGAFAPVLAEPFVAHFGFLRVLVGGTILLSAAGSVLSFLLPREETRSRVVVTTVSPQPAVPGVLGE